MPSKPSPAQLSDSCPYLTINQLAERWQVSIKHIYNLREHGLVATQLGKALRYHIDDVRAFEKRSRR